VLFFLDRFDLHAVPHFLSISPEKDRSENKKAKKQVTARRVNKWQQVSGGLPFLLKKY